MLISFHFDFSVFSSISVLFFLTNWENTLCLKEALAKSNSSVQPFVSLFEGDSNYLSLWAPLGEQWLGRKFIRNDGSGL